MLNSQYSVVLDPGAPGVVAERVADPGQDVDGLTRLDGDVNGSIAGVEGPSLVPQARECVGLEEEQAGSQDAYPESRATLGHDVAREGVGPP